MRDVYATRGATTADANTSEAILEATQELLREVLATNGFEASDLVSILFTATPDLDAAFPAEAARSLGLEDVPLLCATEMAVAEAPALCIRVLVHVRTERRPRPVYLRGARGLRPDLTSDPKVEP